jgi:hypothetical protein
MLNANELANKWRNMPPTTMRKSCEDYRTFLADKKKKAKESAENFINTLRSSLTQRIGQYNANQEATRRLESELNADGWGADVMKVGVVGASTATAGALTR